MPTLNVSFDVQVDVSPTNLLDLVNGIRKGDGEKLEEAISIVGVDFDISFK